MKLVSDLQADVMANWLVGLVLKETEMEVHLVFFELIQSVFS